MLQNCESILHMQKFMQDLNETRELMESLEGGIEKDEVKAQRSAYKGGN